MSNSKLKFAAGIGLLAASLLSSAAIAGDAYYVTPGIGTLGASLKGGYRWSENMGVTGIVSGFAWSQNLSYNGVPATAKTSLFDLGVILDYYPVGGNFRVSGGLRYSNDKVTGTVTDSGTSVGYTATVNSIQPYLGVGYALPVTDRLAVDFDLGAYYMGTPKVTANSAFSNANISSALSKAQSDIGSHSFYPVGQLGLRYEF